MRSEFRTAGRWLVYGPLGLGTLLFITAVALRFIENMGWADSSTFAGMILWIDLLLLIGVMLGLPCMILGAILWLFARA